MVAVFPTDDLAAEAIEDLRTSGLPDDAILDDDVDAARVAGEGAVGRQARDVVAVPVVVGTPGMTKGWLIGALLGALAGIVIGVLVSVIFGVSWPLAMLAGGVASGVTGFVLGGAFGSLAFDEDGGGRAEDDTGVAQAGDHHHSVGVVAADPGTLKVARDILQRHHPVRVTVRH